MSVPINFGMKTHKKQTYHNSNNDPDWVSNGKQAVHGERANFTRIVLGWLAGWLVNRTIGCIEAKFCKKQIVNT